MKKFLCCMILSMSWLIVCMVLYSIGIFVPDCVFYPVLAVILLIVALMFNTEG